MLEDQAGCVPAPARAAFPFRDEVPAHDPGAISPGLIPAPDPVVADSARSRLAAHRALGSGRPVVEGRARRVDDIRAVSAVIDAVRSGVKGAPDALDVGAGLVVLCDLRHHLDCLEADLLDAAERVGLGWDVIAAIVGIPAEEARRRYDALCAGRGSR